MSLAIESPQARPSGFALVSVFELLELSEETRHLLGGHSATCIGDLHTDKTPVEATQDRDRPLVSEFGGVIDEIDENLRDPVPVEDELGRRAGLGHERDFLFIGRILHHRDDFPDGVGQIVLVHLKNHLSRVEFLDGEDVVGDFLEPGQITLHFVHPILLLGRQRAHRARAQQLDVGFQRRQRRAQFVRGHRHETAFHFDELFQTIFGFFHLRHVRADAKNMAFSSGRHGFIGPNDPGALAAFFHVLVHVDLVGLGRLDDLADHVLEILARRLGRGHDRADHALAEDFILAESEKLARERVYERDLPELVHDENDAVGELHNLTKLFFGF